MRMADLVKAAKEYDLKMRPFGQTWTSVPDSQVARLLTGASLAHQGKLADIIQAEAGHPDKQE
jgi:hypothetical protein